MEKIGNQSRRRGGTLPLVDPAKLKYYIHDHAGSFRLQLLGALTSADLPELDGCWRTSMSTISGRRIQIDVRLLLNVDVAGREWLAEMANTRGLEFLCGPGSVAFLPVGLRIETPEQAQVARKRDNLIAQITSFFRSQPRPAEPLPADAGPLALEVRGQNTEVHAS